MNTPKIGAAMEADTLTASDVTIGAVYFAQTHVLEPHHPYFRLVGEKNTLIKVHVLSATGANAPTVQVKLQLNDETETIGLTGPTALPEQFVKEPGKVVHRFDDCFTATIPGRWIQKGLTLTVQAGDIEETFEDLNIGPSIRLQVNMFDVHYFDYEDVDYPENWAMEIAVRRPVTEMNVQRIKRLQFPQLLIGPRGNTPAILCSSEEDYKRQTGHPFNGKQNAALMWARALQDAGGQRNQSMFFINIANVHAGGFAEHFYGCSSLRRFGVLHHEFGHALDVEDLSPTEEPMYPYRGEMHGIDKTDTGGYHIGPTWGYDHRVGIAPAHGDAAFFISPINVIESWKDKLGEWKHSPVRGGAGNDPEAPGTFNMFSDWSVRKMQLYMERRLAKWDEEIQSFRKWNDYRDTHFRPIKNDGVMYPIERDVDVYSIMASANAVTPDANFIYPLIGPYRSGLIATFNPEKEEDREHARRLRDFADGWDVCLRVVQGGVTRTYMMPFAWRPDDDPLDRDSFQTRALNLPVRNGQITHAELLLTPNADIHGLPDKPRILFARNLETAPCEIETTNVNFGS